MTPQRDEHFDKYRVFREPDIDHPAGHPVPIYPPAVNDFSVPGYYGAVQLDEIDGYYFVLRPGKDLHALKALRHYARSVEDTHPNLASDLMEIVRDIEDDEEGEEDAGPNNGR